MKLVKNLLFVFLMIPLILVGCSNSGGKDSEYPSKSLKITVPYAAGGLNDIVSRKVASYGDEFFGTSMAVTNLTGGGGTTAATEYLKEEANTHNLMLGSQSIFVTIPLEQDVQYTFDEFEPIIGIDNVQFVLYTNPEKTGIDSIESLIEYGKENTIKFGTEGPGSDPHLIQTGLFAMAEVDAEPVVYGGGGESVTNVVSGNIDVAAGPPAVGKEFITDGSLVPIAVAGPEPYVGFDGFTVPTLTEEGYAIDYSGFNFFVIKKGTDEENIQYLHDAIKKVYETDDFKELESNLEIDLMPIGPDEIKEHIKNQQAQAEELYELVESLK